MNKIKNVLITGGLGGIGFDICKYFILKSYNIIIIDKLSNNKFNQILYDNSIMNSKTKIFYKKIDLTKPNQIKKMFQSLKSKFSSIDILINCAGIQHISPIENFSENMWERVLSINLSSFFYTSKYVLPLMKKNKWGRIINICSVHGQVASINKSAYVASKHGMIGLTKTIALETATLPITCNAICPGWVNTPIVSKQIDQRVKNNKSSRKKRRIQFIKRKTSEFVFYSRSRHCISCLLFVH